MRSRVNRRKGIQSLANATVFTSPADASASDRRGKTNNRGEQGMGTCSECGIEMAQRKVTYGNPSRYGDLPTGTIVIGAHRVGGGTFSPRRGDAICPGAGMPSA